MTLVELSASVYEMCQTMHCMLDHFLLAEYRGRELQSGVRDGFKSLS